MNRLKRVVRQQLSFFLSQEGRRSRLSYLKPVAGLIIFALVIVFFVSRVQSTAGELSAHYVPVEFNSILLSLFIVLGCYVIIAVAWWFLQKQLGGQLSLRQGLRIYYLSSLPRYIPGLIWGYAGRTYLCEKEGVPRMQAVVSTVIEVALLVVTGISTAAFYLFGFTTASGIALFIDVLLVVSLTILFTLLKKERPSFGALSRAVVLWSVVTVVYMLFWGVYGTSIVVLVMPSLSSINSADIIRICSGFALAWLAGFMAIFVPGGLGVREAGLVIVLEPIAGSLVASYVAVLSRFLNLMADVIMFLIVAKKLRARESLLVK